MKPQAKISTSNFTKLITQANLTLSDDQQVKIHAQLDEAIKAIEVLQELDTTNIDSTSSASGLTNIFREDIVTPSFSQVSALSNAKTTHNGYFVATAVFENQDN